MWCVHKEKVFEKKLSCEVYLSTLCCRVAQVRGDGCVRAAPLLRRHPEPCLDKQIFQATEVLLRRARDLFLDLHALSSKVFVLQRMSWSAPW